jgi:hypothetical protein
MTEISGHEDGLLKRYARHLRQRRTNRNREKVCCLCCFVEDDIEGKKGKQKGKKALRVRSIRTYCALGARQQYRMQLRSGFGREEGVGLGFRESGSALGGVLEGSCTDRVCESSTVVHLQPINK